MIIPKFRIVVISSLEDGVLWAFGNVFLTYMVVTEVFVLQSSVHLCFSYTYVLVIFPRIIYF